VGTDAVPSDLDAVHAPGADPRRAAGDERSDVFGLGAITVRDPFPKNRVAAVRIQEVGGAEHANGRQPVRRAGGVAPLWGRTSG